MLSKNGELTKDKQQEYKESSEKYEKLV